MNTKQLNKIAKSSKGANKVVEAIKKGRKLGAERTQMDAVRLINNLWKLEDKSLSKVYSNLSKAEGEIADLIKEVLGNKDFPTWKEFVTMHNERTAKLKTQKQLFSMYDGLLTLKKFNVIAQTKAKVERQNKKQSTKLGDSNPMSAKMLELHTKQAKKVEVAA